ncbi:hypothetical protein N7466_004959 [Penicillium verhagenii]|uniref:uncharacterized protein n=1 Tax=Penicillium verhagenii TaxID=1562060 RepID=UPI0025453888|nr:uncharacterized protein N7466_004959 [Penicillium verhagenii]KAJ5935412.1 hypothetical protein N7466_004959 [Penicillium verhagenii]
MSDRNGPPSLPPSPPSEQLIERDFPRAFTDATGQVFYSPGDQTIVSTLGSLVPLLCNSRLASIPDSNALKDSFSAINFLAFLYANFSPGKFESLYILFDGHRVNQETQIIHDPAMNTPSTTSCEELGRISASPTPSWSPLPQRRAGTPRRPRERRPRRASTKRKAKTEIDIDEPFSISTAHMTNIPIRDMHAWAHRPAEERHEQARQKNKIPRPMNAFMMYRSAYAERAKAFLHQNNYQFVNSWIAASWDIETEDLKNYYRDIASLESKNHHFVHPQYKFSPNRGPVVAAVAEPVAPSHPGPFVADHGSPAWSDLDYAPSQASFHERSHSLPTDVVYHSRSTTPMNSIQEMSSFGQPVWSGGYPMQNYNTALQMMTTPYEDMYQGHRRWTVSNGLNGLPGGSHHDLLQPHHNDAISGRVSVEGSLDPQVLSYKVESEDTSILTPAYSAVPNPYPEWNERDTYLGVPAVSGASSPAQYPQAPLMSSSLPTSLQHNPSWDPNHYHSLNDMGESWEAAPLSKL